MRTLQSCNLLLVLLVAGLGADWSSAQGYPTKPVRIHTAGAGGGSDTAARLAAAELTISLGQAFIVENKPAGPVLVTGVAKAAPDGYTLLVSGGAVWISPLFEDASWDALRDFAPITALTQSPAVLVVHPAVPAKSIKELIAYAKSKPGVMNYTSGANGASSHTAGELFKSLAGVDIVRIVYKSSAQELADMLSGQAQMTFGGPTSIAAHIKAGKLRALATTGTQRSVLMPDLPTVAETLPGYVSEQLLGFFAPGKTPEAIVRRLSQETMRALNKPESRDKLLQAGLEVGGGTSEQFTELIKSEIARLDKMIKEAGLKK